MAGFDGAFARSFIGAMCELSHAQVGAGGKRAQKRALSGPARIRLSGGGCRTAGRQGLILVAQVLFDDDIDVQRLAVADHRDGELGAGAALYDLVHDGTHAGDGLSVDLEQYIPTFECRLS